MRTNINVNINLPQSELTILKKMAKAWGWNLFVMQENTSGVAHHEELVKKLYGCIQLPEDFDYKKELEQAISDKYKL